MAGGRGPGSYGPMRTPFLSEEEKENQPSVTPALLKRIFSYLKPYGKQLVLVLICIAASSFLSLLPSILTGKIIDEGLINRDLKALIFFIVLSLAVTFLANLIGVAESYINTWIAQHITYDMRNQMYAHLQKMSQRFYTTNNQGDIVTRMTSDIDGVQTVIANTFTSILSNVITLVIAAIAMFQKNWILALVGIIIVPLFTLPTRKAGKTRWSLTNESQAANDQINGILNETLSVSGQLLVKLFGKEKREYDRYEQINRKMIRLNIRERMAGRWFLVVLTTFTSIGPMLIYLVGGILMIRYDHNLTVGDITVMVALLGKMYMPVNSLLNIQVEWIRSMSLFTRIFNYFDIPPEIESAPDAVTPETVTGNVEFSHVSFAYEEPKRILKDISFRLEAGKSIAIVGPSGSGKSTIINLIPRLYDVSEGSVTFDGIDVRKLDLQFLRSQVGVVSQETYLFNGTIRENLLYAKEDATEAEMIEALQKANIYDFVSKQELGLDTQVGNRGLKLSGGEKQRISIARALLRKTPVLFVDEATASLDAETSFEVLDAILDLDGYTRVIVTHDLDENILKRCTKLFTLRNGAVYEQGTFDDLLEKKGYFYSLFTVSQK